MLHCRLLSPMCDVPDALLLLLDSLRNEPRFHFESTNGPPCLLLVEYRECPCLNATRVLYLVIYRKCLAVFGDCAADLAYRFASPF